MTVVRVTDCELAARIESLAREHLGVSGEEAIAMIERGELDGTGLQVEIECCLWLMGRRVNRR